jgi:hypothetical protein
MAGLTKEQLAELAKSFGADPAKVREGPQITSIPIPTGGMPSASAAPITNVFNGMKSPIRGQAAPAAPAPIPVPTAGVPGIPGAPQVSGVRTVTSMFAPSMPDSNLPEARPAPALPPMMADVNVNGRDLGRVAAPGPMPAGGAPLARAAAATPPAHKDAWYKRMAASIWKDIQNPREIGNSVAGGFLGTYASAAEVAGGAADKFGLQLPTMPVASVPGGALPPGWMQPASNQNPTGTMNSGADLSQFGYETGEKISGQFPVTDQGGLDMVAGSLGSMLAFTTTGLLMPGIAPEATTAGGLKGLMTAERFLRAAFGAAGSSIFESAVEQADLMHELRTQNPGMTPGEAWDQSYGVFWKQVVPNAILGLPLFDPARKGLEVLIEGSSEGVQEGYQYIIQEMARGRSLKDVLHDEQFLIAIGIGGLIGAGAAAVMPKDEPLTSPPIFGPNPELDAQVTQVMGDMALEKQLAFAAARITSVPTDYLVTMLERVRYAAAQPGASPGYAQFAQMIEEEIAGREDGSRPNNGTGQLDEMLGGEEGRSPVAPTPQTPAGPAVGAPAPSAPQGDSQGASEALPTPPIDPAANPPEGPGTLGTPVVTPIPIPPQPAGSPVTHMEWTGQPSQVVFHGSGRENRGDAYNPMSGRDPVPIAGKGKYFALQGEDAEYYGPNVEAVQAGELVKNPFVISDDTAWRELLKASGAETPIGVKGENFVLAPGWNEKIRAYLLSKGYDGLVVSFPTTDDGADGDGHGRWWKSLEHNFGHSTLVAYGDAHSTSTQPGFPSPPSSPRSVMRGPGAQQAGSPATAPRAGQVDTRWGNPSVDTRTDDELDYAADEAYQTAVSQEQDENYEPLANSVQVWAMDSEDGVMGTVLTEFDGTFADAVEKARELWHEIGKLFVGSGEHDPKWSHLAIYDANGVASLEIRDDGKGGMKITKASEGGVVPEGYGAKPKAEAKPKSEPKPKKEKAPTKKELAEKAKKERWAKEDEERRQRAAEQDKLYRDLAIKLFVRSGISEEDAAARIDELALNDFRDIGSMLDGHVTHRVEFSNPSKEAEEYMAYQEALILEWMENGREQEIYEWMRENDKYYKPFTSIPSHYFENPRGYAGGYARIDESFEGDVYEEDFGKTLYLVQGKPPEPGIPVYETYSNEQEAKAKFDELKAQIAEAAKPAGKLKAAAKDKAKGKGKPEFGPPSEQELVSSQEIPGVGTVKLTQFYNLVDGRKVYRWILHNPWGGTTYYEDGSMATARYKELVADLKKEQKEKGKSTPKAAPAAEQTSAPAVVEDEILKNAKAQKDIDPYSWGRGWKKGKFKADLFLDGPSEIEGYILGGVGIGRHPTNGNWVAVHIGSGKLILNKDNKMPLDMTKILAGRMADIFDMSMSEKEMNDSGVIAEMAAVMKTFRADPRYGDAYAAILRVREEKADTRTSAEKADDAMKTAKDKLKGKGKAESGKMYWTDTQPGATFSVMGHYQGKFYVSGEGALVPTNWENEFFDTQEEARAFLDEAVAEVESISTEERERRIKVNTEKASKPPKGSTAKAPKIHLESPAWMVELDDKNNREYREAAYRVAQNTESERLQDGVVDQYTGDEWAGTGTIIIRNKLGDVIGITQINIGNNSRSDSEDWAGFMVWEALDAYKGEMSKEWSEVILNHRKGEVCSFYHASQFTFGPEVHKNYAPSAELKSIGPVVSRKAAGISALRARGRHITKAPSNIASAFNRHATPYRDTLIKKEGWREATDAQVTQAFGAKYVGELLKICKILGLDVKFYDGRMTGLQGFYIAAEKTIAIHIKSVEPIGYVLAHELGHHLHILEGKLLSKITDGLTLIDQPARMKIAALTKFYRVPHLRLEVMADIAADELINGGGIAKILAELSPNELMRLRKAIDTVISGLLKKFGITTPSVRMVNDLAALDRRVKRAVDDVIRSVTIKKKKMPRGLRSDLRGLRTIGGLSYREGMIRKADGLGGWGSPEIALWTRIDEDDVADMLNPTSRMLMQIAKALGVEVRFFDTTRIQGINHIGGFYLGNGSIAINATNISDSAEDYMTGERRTNHLADKMVEVIGHEIGHAMHFEHRALFARVVAKHFSTEVTGADAFTAMQKKWAYPPAAITDEVIADIGLEILTDSTMRADLLRELGVKDRLTIGNIIAKIFAKVRAALSGVSAEEMSKAEREKALKFLADIEDGYFNALADLASDWEKIDLKEHHNKLIADREGYATEISSPKPSLSGGISRTDRALNQINKHIGDLVDQIDQAMADGKPYGHLETALKAANEHRAMLEAEASAAPEALGKATPPAAAPATPKAPKKPKKPRKPKPQFQHHDLNVTQPVRRRVKFKEWVPSVMRGRIEGYEMARRAASGPHLIDDGLGTWIRFKGNRLYTDIVDYMHMARIQIDKAMEQVGDHRSSLGIMEDPTIMGQLMSGWAGVAQGFIRKKVTGLHDSAHVILDFGLESVLYDPKYKIRSNWREFNDYLQAKREVEVYSKKGSHYLKPKNITGKVHLADSVDIVARCESKFKDWAEAADKITEWNNAVKLFARDSGLISRAQYDAFTQLYDMYVPLHALASLGRGGAINTTNKNVRPSTIIQTQGVLRDGVYVIPPIEAMINNVHYIVRAALLNDNRRRMVQLCDKTNEKFRSQNKTRLDPSITGQFELGHRIQTPVMPIFKRKRALVKAAGVSPEALEAALSGQDPEVDVELDEDTVAQVMDITGLTPEQLSVMTKLWVSSSELGDNVISVNIAASEAEVNAYEKEYKKAKKEYDDAVNNGADMAELEEKGAHLLVAAQAFGQARRGKRVFYELQPEVYEIFQGQGAASPDLWLQTLGKMSTLLRAGATSYSPKFPFRNPIRDAEQALVTSQHLINIKDGNLARSFADLVLIGPRVLRAFFESLFEGNVPKVLQKILDKDIWDEASLNYAFYSELVSMDLTDSQKRMNEEFDRGGGRIRYLVKHPLFAMQLYSQKSEQATRLAVYRKTRDDLYRANEVTKQEAKLWAGLNARESSTDFQMRGAKMPAARVAWSFLNASIQGADLTRRSLFSRRVKNKRYNWAMAFLTITLHSLANWLSYRDEEWYQKLTRYEKNYFWVWRLDKTGQKRLYVPKPFTLGFTFGTMLEVALDELFKNDPRALEKALPMLEAQLNPFSNVAIASTWQGIQDAESNYSHWRGDYIVKGRSQEGLSLYQYNEQTSYAAREIARVIDRAPFLPRKMRPWFREGMPEWTKSPVKLDYVTAATIGSAQETLKMVSNRVIAMANPEYRHSKPLANAIFADVPADFPGINALFKAGEPTSTRYSEDFWTYLTRAKQVASSWNAAQNGEISPEALADMIETDALYIGFYQELTAVSQEISMAVGARMSIRAENFKIFTPAQKREFDELIKGSVNDEMKRVVDAIYFLEENEQARAEFTADIADDIRQVLKDMRGANNE